MSKSNYTSYPDVATVRRQARERWEKQYRKGISIQERIGESVPWWVVIVALVFFFLSVPHTMAVFEKITPDVGKIAPFGIEFGLLFASFRRRVGRMTAPLLVLEVLLFLTAIIVNGAGSLEAVVASTEDVSRQSVTELIDAMPNLPATSQVALVLVPMAAFIIPIGTVAAGEGLASLVLERREDGSLMEDRWKEEQQQVEFEALRDAAISAGQRVDRAVNWAAQVVKVSFDADSSDGVQLSDGLRQDTSSGRSQAEKEASSGHGTGHGYSKNMSARDTVLEYLNQHPDAAEMSVRELADAVSADSDRVSKTTAADALREWRAQVTHRNGHSDDTTLSDHP